jgi:hypothetical protein
MGDKGVLRMTAEITRKRALEVARDAILDDE